MDFNKISQAIDSGSLLGNQTPTYNYEQTLHQQKQYNPNNYRQNQLLAATERNRERLGGLQEELDHNINEWRKAGFSEELIQEQANKFIKLRSMSSQERLDNVIRFQNNDPSAVEDIELAQDIATKDTAFLEGKYGKAVASFAYEKSQQDMQNLNILSGKKSFDFFSWDNAKDMGVSVLRKGVDTVNSMGNAIDLAINGEDAVERIANREGLLDNLSDEINSWHTHEFDRATKRNEVRDSIRDEIENQKAIDYLAQGYTNDRARSKANTDRQLEQIGDVFEEGSTLSAQSAELGADLLIGGAVAKGAQLIGKGAGKLVGKVIENQAKKNIAKAGAKLADKAEPKLQATFSGEKTASQIAQARLAGDKVNNTLGKASPYQINGKATIIDKGDEHIYNSTLLGSKIKSEARDTATQAGNAIEKSRDSVINYQKAQIAQKFTNKSQRLLNTVKKDIDELVTNAGKFTAGIGVTAHGSNQEAIEAVGSTYNQMMSIEPDKLYNTVKGKEIIDSLVQEKGFNSFEEAKKDKGFMEALYEKQSNLAKTASISAYKEVFKNSVLVNALSSRAELAVGGVTDKVKGFKKHLTDFAFKTLGESAEEFVEGYSGEYHPKDEINKALQSTVFDPTKQAASIGAQGAIVAALGTSGINALPLGAKGVKKGAQAVTQPIAQKINQNSQQQLQQHQMNQVINMVQPFNSITTNNPNTSGSIGSGNNPSSVPPSTPPNNPPSTPPNNPPSTPPNNPPSTPPNNPPSSPSGGAPSSPITQPTTTTQQPQVNNAGIVQKVKNVFTKQQVNDIDQLGMQNYSATKFGQELQKLDDEINNLPDSEFKRNFDNAHTPVAKLNALTNMAGHAYDTYKTLSGKQSLTKDEQDKLNTASSLINYQHQTIEKLRDALYETTVDNLNLAQAEVNQKVAEYQVHYQKVKANGGDTNSDPYLQKLENEVTQLQARVNEFNNRYQNDFSQGLLADTYAEQLVNEQLYTLPTVNTSVTQVENMVQDRWSDWVNDGSSSVARENTPQGQLELAIEAIDNDNTLSKELKSLAKRKIAKEFVKGLSKLLATDRVDIKNAKNHYLGSIQAAKALLNLLNNEDLGISQNNKQPLVALVQAIVSQEDKVKNWKSKTGDYGALLVGFEKFIGNPVRDAQGNRGGKGLLEYALDAIQNKGRLPAGSIAQLVYFSATQNAKLAELESLVKQYEGQKTFSPVRLYNPKLSVYDPYTKTIYDTRIYSEFSNYDKLHNYYTIVKSEADAFSELANSILKKGGVNKTGLTGKGVTTNTGSIKVTNTKPSRPVKPKKSKAKKVPKAGKPQNQQQFFNFADTGSARWSTNEERLSVVEDSPELSEFAENFLNRVSLGKGFNFNRQQWEALKYVIDAITAQNSQRASLTDEEKRKFKYKPVMLAGFAGTGKTTIIKYALEYMQKTPAYLTTTHAASAVIRQKTDAPATTVNKAIYIDKKTGLPRPSKHMPFNDILVIDESSMLSPQQVNMINSISSRPIIYMGDLAQLPEPNSDRISRAFDVDYMYVMTDVMRTDNNAILDLLTSVRNNTNESLGQLPHFESANGLNKYNSTSDLDKEAITAIAKDDSNNSVYITYTNQKANEISAKVREQKYGNANIEPQLNEYIIGHGGTDSKQPTEGELGNSISYKITKIEQTDRFEKTLTLQDTKYGLPDASVIVKPLSKDDFFQLDGITEEGYTQNKQDILNEIKESTNILSYIHRAHKRSLDFKEIARVNDIIESEVNPLLNKYAITGNYMIIPVETNDGLHLEIVPFNAKLQQELFNKHRNIMSILSKVKLNQSAGYPYAITSYKSQGQTFGNVYVNLNDLPLDKLIKNAKGEVVTSVNNSSMYVALSRASKSLHISTESKNGYSTKTVNIKYGEGEFGYLSNFQPVPNGFMYRGHRFESIEHAYQTLKHRNFDDFIMVSQDEINHAESIKESLISSNYYKKPKGYKSANTAQSANGVPHNVRLMYDLMLTRMSQDPKYQELILKAHNKSRVTHNLGSVDFWTNAFPVLLGQMNKALLEDKALPRKLLSIALRDRIYGATQNQSSNGMDKTIQSDVGKIIKSNKFIANSNDDTSLTGIYQQTLPQSMTNVGTYEKGDVVFVSVNPNEVLHGNTKNLIDIASKAGVTFITNPSTVRSKNQSENALADILRKTHTEVIKDGVGTGTWIPKAESTNTLGSTRLEKVFTRENVLNNPKNIYVFGDNAADAKTNYVPKSTQAVIRGLPTAIGIVTKHNRLTNSDSYLNDNDFDRAKKHIDHQISRLKQLQQLGYDIVLPEDGIGTGKADLANKAPKIFQYLTEQLRTINPNYLPDVQFKPVVVNTNLGTNQSTGNKPLKEKLTNVYSGGAYGADGLWDNLLRHFGITKDKILHFTIGSNKNHTNKDLNILDVNDSIENDVRVLADKTSNQELKARLNTLLDNLANADTDVKKYAAKLQLRNVLQVSNANGVFGVMPIINGKLGNSGTKTAIELGAISSRPTYVLNTENNKWYSVSYYNNDFVVSLYDGIPPITSKPALVGTREIESYYKNGSMTKIHNNTNNILAAMLTFLRTNDETSNDTVTSTDTSDETAPLNVDVNSLYDKLYHHPLVTNQNSQGAIWGMRNNRINLLFGNPYSYTVQGNGLLPASSVKDAVIKYLDYILNSNADDAKEFRKLIRYRLRLDTNDNRNLANKPIFYNNNRHSEISHADALAYLFNDPNSPFVIEAMEHNSAITTGSADSSVLYSDHADIAQLSQGVHWEHSTGQYLQDRYDHSLAKEYRTQGLDIFRNADGTFTINNALKSKHIHINEEKDKLLNKVGQERIYTKEGREKIVDSIIENQSDKQESLEYLDGYATLLTEFKKYFDLNKGWLDSPNENEFRLSGILNFIIQVKDPTTGQPINSIHHDLIQAMTTSLVKEVTAPRATPDGKHAREHFTNHGEKKSVVIDISNRPNVKQSDTSKEWVENTINQYALKGEHDYAFENLGSEKNQFTYELGLRTLKVLGISLKSEEDRRLFDGMAYSLGAELLNFGLKAKIFEMSRVITSNFDDFDSGNTDSFVTSDYVKISPFIQRKSKANNYTSLTYSQLAKVEDESIASEIIKAIDHKNPLMAGLARLVRYKHSTVGDFIIPEVKDGAHGMRITEPYKAKDSDIENKSVSGKNDLAKEMVDAQNQIKWRVNSVNGKDGFFEFLSPNNPNGIEFLTSSLANHSTEGNIDAVNDSNEAKNQSILRQIAIMHENVYNLEDPYVDIYLKHNMTSVQRISISSTVNPQSLKLIRDLLLPSSQIDGKPIEHGFNAKDMSIEDLLNRARELLDITPQEEIYSEDINTLMNSEYHNITGYVMALAQALGVKIEKTLDKNAINQLEVILDKPELRAMIDELVKGLNGEQMDNSVARIASEHGIDSSRAFLAMFTLAQMISGKGLNSKGLFQPTLPIELDGRGNGVFNGLRQFTPEPTGKFFSTLKSTGNVTPDALAVMDNVEGAKSLFDTEPEFKAHDVYQIVSDHANEKDINDLIIIASGVLINGKPLTEFSIKELNYLAIDKLTKLLNKVFAEDENNPSYEENNVKVELIPNYWHDSNILDVESSETRDAHGEIVKKLINTLTYFGFADAYNVKNWREVPLNQLLSQGVGRQIAKDSLTPSNYGGRLDGITNQIVSTITSNMLAFFNDIYQKDEITNQDLLETLRYLDSINVPYENLSTSNLKDFLKSLKFTLNGKKAAPVKSTVGQVMLNSIDAKYGEQFSIIQGLITQDTMLFQQFILEFNDVVTGAIERRNREKGYVNEKGIVVDPRAWDFLSEGEVLHIMSTLQVSPNVATAMTKDKQFIRSLVHTGNSILGKSSHSQRRDSDSSTFSLVDFNKSAGALRVKIKDKWNEFNNAGASLLTSTIVSTESRSMGELQKLLNKKGLAVGQVFDGSEVNPIFRFLVGQNLNRLTDEVHTETSLMENFYHKLNRSNLASTYREYLNDPEVRQELLAIISNREAEIGAKTISLLTAVLATDASKYTMGLKRINNEANNLFAMVRVPLENAFNEALINGKAKVVLYTDNQKMLLGDTANKLIQFQEINKDTNTRMSVTPADFIEDKVNEMLIITKETAVNQKALQKILDKLFMQVVDQFGGASHGYNKNFESSKAQKVQERLGEFISNYIRDNPLTELNQDVLSELLANFIKTDEEIQHQLNLEKDKFSGTMPLGTRPNRLPRTKNVQTTKEVMSELARIASIYKNDSSIVAKTFLTKLPIINQMLSSLPNNIGIYTNYADYMAKASELGLNLSFGKNDAFFHYRVGIYVPSYHELTTLAHELQHLMTDNFFAGHYQFEHSKDYPLTQEQKASISLLEKIAINMAEDHLTLSGVQKIINALKKGASDRDIYSKHKLFEAVLAKVYYAFKEEHPDKSPEEIQKLKYEAMKEFYAYAHSEADILTAMQYGTLKNRKQVMEDTGFRKVLDKYKDYFKKIFNSLRTLFGIRTVKDENGKLSYGVFDDSYLADSIKAMHVLGINPAQSENSLNGSGSARVGTSHSTYLDDLNKNIDERLSLMVTNPQGNLVTDYQDEYALLTDNQIHQDINTLNANLISSQIPSTQEERTVMGKLYAIGKTMYGEANAEFTERVSRLASDFTDTIDLIDFDNTFGSGAYDKLISTDNVGILAVLASNEALKTYVENLPPVTRTKLQNYEERISNAVLFKHLKNHPDFKNMTQIEKLAEVVASFDYRSKLTTKQNQVIKDKEILDRGNRLHALDFIKSIGNAVPSDRLSDLISVTATEFFSGTYITEQDRHSLLGKAIQHWSDTRMAIKGKPTILNAFLNLIRGAHDQVERIYGLQNQLSILPNKIREQFGHTISANIREAFSKPVSLEQNRSISRVFNKGMLYRLAPQLRTGSKLISMLSNKQERLVELNQENNNLASKLASFGMPAQTISDVMDFIEWQTSGLAEMLNKGEAKAELADVPNMILRNTRAISSLNFINIRLSEQEFKAVKESVDNIVSLKSIDHMNQTDINNITDLITNEQKGIELIIKELNALEQQSLNKDSYGSLSYLSGYDGYEHSQNNPYQDYQIIDNTKDEERYKKLGYSHISTFPTGQKVYYNANAVNKPFKQGIFTLTSDSFYGSNDRGLMLHSNQKIINNKGNKNTEFYKFFNTRVRGNRNYYSSLPTTNSYGVVINDRGIDSYALDLNQVTKDSLIGTKDIGIEAIASGFSRNLEEIMAERENNKAVEILRDIHAKDPDKSNYVLVSINSPIPRVAEFAKMLPNNVNLSEPLYINMKVLDQIIGYKGFSITDLLEENPQGDSNTKKLFRESLSSAFKAFNVNPTNGLNTIERVLKEVTATGKDIILIKSIVVPVQNLLSNVIHLAMVGVPLQQIPTLLYKGYSEVLRYQELLKKEAGLVHKQRVATSQNELIKIQKQIQLTRQERQSLSISPLIKEGILTNISQRTEIEETSFSLRDKLADKIDLNSRINKLPEGVKSLLILKDSKLHNMLSTTLDYGDFIGKYALYTHLTKNKGWNHDRTMTVVRDEFVNYAQNRGALFDWYNSIGLGWFLSYKLGIQRIIYRNLRRNTLRTLAVWSGSNALRDTNTLLGDFVQTVPQQRLWTDYGGYHLDATNIVGSMQSHWIEKLLF